MVTSCNNFPTGQCVSAQSVSSAKSRMKLLFCDRIMYELAVFAEVQLENNKALLPFGYTVKLCKITLDGFGVFLVEY